MSTRVDHSPVSLNDTIQRLLSGTASPSDVADLQQALASGNITLATGDGSVAIGGDANQAIIITGDNTQFILTAEALALLRYTPYQPPAIPEQGKLAESGQLPPCSWLPFARNAVFTGREADLLALADALLYAADRSRVGIIEAATIATGLGGVGKSQLAVEFCYRYGRYFHGVHWLQANQNMHAEIATCGAKMGLRPWPERKPEQVQATLQAWGSSEKRLVVLDNAEDPAVVQEWLPQLGNAAVLLTARRAEWPPDLGLKQHPLDIFPRPQSLALLRKLAERLKSVPDEALGQLAQRLGDLPLALDLAGRYLKQRRRLSVEGYLKELEAAGSALGHESQADWTSHSPTRHATSLFATFQLSWAQAQDEIAKRLFEAAGYCAPGVVIPWEVLKMSAGGKDQITDSQFDRAVGVLGDLGLGTVSDAPAVGVKFDLGLGAVREAGLTMHPLLAEFGRGEDGKHESLSRLMDTLVTLTCQSARSGNPSRFRPLRAHIQAVAQMAEAAGLEDTSTLWNNLGYLLCEVAEYGAAQAVFERALGIDVGTFGLNHPNDARDLNSLGFVEQAQGNLDEARQTFELALHIGETTLGPNHPDVAIYINNLGGVLQALGDLDAARKAFERALAIREKTLGKNHPDTAISLNDLGGLFYEQRDYLQAKSYAEQAVSIWEQAFGPHHPWIATAAITLGNVQLALGELDKARASLKWALGIDVGTFGLNHPSVARDLNSLGFVEKAQGNLDEARRTFELALHIGETTLGPNHPHVAIYINDLGGVLLALGDLDAARKAFEWALAIDEAVFGPNHPNVARIVFNLGSVLQAQGDLDGAWNAFMRALVILEHFFPLNHPEISSVVNQLFLIKLTRQPQKND